MSFLKITNNSWNEPPQGDFIINSGETKILYPGSVRHFNDLIIEKNGNLIIQNGIQRFTCIKVSGKCLIKGKITCRNFISGRGSFSNEAPDANILDAILDESNLGGDGGKGGGVKDYYRTFKPGGAGAYGTENYGGGGGSGAGEKGVRRAKAVRGTNAVDRLGATLNNINLPGGQGGNGGRRNGRINGGYLYLRVEKEFDFSDGIFDFRGSKGENGSDGKLASGGGGGGGGAPGGQGGILYLKLPAPPGEINFLANGGPGGNGGKGARTRRDGGPVAEHRFGENGKRGEKGFDGFIIEL
jgi:hypothetical protein